MRDARPFFHAESETPAHLDKSASKRPTGLCTIWISKTFSKSKRRVVVTQSNVSERMRYVDMCPFCASGRFLVY